MQSAFSLKGKTALVTGASGGIGGAITTMLHQQGATVMISGTRREALEQLANTLGEGVHIQTCNLRDEQETEQLIDHVVTTLGKLDILICNAGLTQDGLAMRMKNDAFMDVIHVNLLSTFILNRNAIKVMMKQRYGRIINISSIVALNGNPGQANYAASKAGMIGMSKSIAAEVATRGITVNCIAPGFISTPMTDQLNEEQKQKLMSGIPAARFGTPLDVAGCAAFLASEEAAYITGQTLHVNGGMLMV